jgi:glycosyltransferase involved in cell wall biosynthesis
MNCTASPRDQASLTHPTIVQFNTSPTLGGAEVYTASFSRALAQRGWPTRVLVDPVASFWRHLDFADVPHRPLPRGERVLGEDEVALIHAPLPQETLAAMAGNRVIGLAHQAIYDAAHPAYYDRADVLLAVSQHVITSLRRHGLDRVHPDPLYGVADLTRGGTAGELRQGPLFDADARKPRDRIMAAFVRARTMFAAPPHFRRKEGLTLGIVSRLAPLKQFPLLFAQLVPVLLRHPRVNLEIFGAAVGYKSLSALQDALAPLAPRVRYWGHQRDVASAYRGLDYLLTGLPEREALGLNALEACAAGTPVLAVDAPPFNETLKDGITGFFYTDPRLDSARDFERVLSGIEGGELRPRSAALAAHLAAFSASRFADRVDTAMHAILRAPRAAHI